MPDHRHHGRELGFYIETEKITSSDTKWLEASKLEGSETAGKGVIKEQHQWG